MALRDSTTPEKESDIERVKNVVDVAVGAGIYASLMNWLPTGAAALGILYTIARFIIEWPKLKTRLKEIFGWQ